ncbi:MAG: CDP-alcohol phosphatidyltransferase family protein [Gammaproteobacteria bacterium]
MSSPVSDQCARRGSRRKALSQLANSITGLRFACAPALLWLGWNDYAVGFLALLGAAFVSDAVDGFIARKFRLESELGAKLDSTADWVIYSVIPIAAWWLWPELVRRELFFVALVIVSYTVPVAWGRIKFGVFTSYHTRSVKLAAGLMGFTVIVFFAGGPVWPFRVAAVMCVIAALEEIAITAVLSKQKRDIPSLWHALKEPHR